MTCDPSTRRIEARLKDGATIQIAIWEIPSGFRWPQEGEYWTVQYRNNFWHLGQPMEIGESNKPIEDLAPGDTKIGGGDNTKIYIDAELVDIDGRQYYRLPETIPTVTGSRGGNAALASLLTTLEGLGLIEDNTTA